jgi:hypothetical protein
LTAAVLSVALIGPFGLGRWRHRDGRHPHHPAPNAGLVLARAGASRALVLGTQLWQGALVAGGAATVGLLLAMALIDAHDSQLSPVLAAATALATLVLLGGATWSVARRSLGGLARDDSPVLRVAPRRLVVEATVVVIAVAATLLLRQRGLLLDEATGVTRFDPLLASVPVVSGLAAGSCSAASTRCRSASSAGSRRAAATSCRSSASGASADSPPRPACRCWC